MVETKLEGANENNKKLTEDKAGLEQALHTTGK